MASRPEDVLRIWSASAAYWEKHRCTIRRMFEPVTRALVKDAGIVGGESVLDVAAGTGEPSLTIAEVVGSKGAVTCTDAVAGMVVAARQEAQQCQLNNIRFCQCAAEALPFRDRLFDQVVCRFGVMFFLGPVGELREMLRVLRPDGRLTFAVWHTSQSNPMHRIPADVVSRYVESPAADPDSPGAFRFAQPGKLAALLERAGAVHVRERLVQFQIEAPISIDQFWEVRSEMSDTLRDKLARLSPAQLERVMREVKDATRQFFSGNQMSFPAEVLIVSGVAP